MKFIQKDRFDQKDNNFAQKDHLRQKTIDKDMNAC